MFSDVTECSDHCGINKLFRLINVPTRGGGSVITNPLSKGQAVVQKPHRSTEAHKFKRIQPFGVLLCIINIFRLKIYAYINVSCLKRETWEKDQETPVMTRLLHLALLLTQMTKEVTQVFNEKC